MRILVLVRMISRWRRALRRLEAAAGAGGSVEVEASAKMLGACVMELEELVAANRAEALDVPSMRVGEPDGTSTRGDSPDADMVELCEILWNSAGSA